MKLSPNMRVMLAHGRYAEWRTLREALQFSIGWSTSVLEDVILYNALLRDRLRWSGIDALASELKEICPSEDFVKIMDKWVNENKELKVADYTIQAQLITEPIHLLGYTFRDFDDLKSQVDNEHGPLYIRKESELYPCFDSFDYAYENRYYQHYYIRTHLIDKDESYPNPGELRFSERIPEDQLPIVYYRGEGQCLLVITQ